jgi:hypothetical protein
MCFAGVYGQLEDRKLREEPADGREILERCLVTYQPNVNPVLTASFPAKGGKKIRGAGWEMISRNLHDLFE